MPPKNQFMLLLVICGSNNDNDNNNNNTCADGITTTTTGAHPASCKMGTGPFSGVKFCRVVLLNTHPISCCGHGREEL